MNILEKIVRVPKALVLTAGIFFAVSASQASTFTISITASQVIAAVAATGSTILVDSCTKDLLNCGIYGVGFNDIGGVNGVGGTVFTSSNSVLTNAGSPVPAPNSAAWNVGTSGNSYPTYQFGGTDTNVTFITAAADPASAGTYNNLLNSSSVAATGIAKISGTTKLSFQVALPAGSATPTGPLNLYLELVLLANGGSDASNSKKSAINVDLSSYTVVATPEPASIALLFSGVAAFALRRRFSSR